MWDTVWMDQGGTFTDVVRRDLDGRVEIRKELSATVALDAWADRGADLRRGTTVATNALLEGNGVPTLLITTQGFGDIPWIGDQTRPDLFELEIRRPKPLCKTVLEINGRIDVRGRLLEPHHMVEADLQPWRDAGIEAVAIVLVHGTLVPDEEKRLGEMCRSMGFSQVSLGHEVAPSRGFLARVETTLADAALSPLLPRAPGHYMRSDGGLAWESGTGSQEWRGCHAVLSGPAGGVIATAALAREEGLDQVIGFDMGGTSTDVSRIAGAPDRTDHLTIAGRRLRVPVVRLETVAAGGGSLLQVQAGLYQVGPRSAGSIPGPACYGRGGPAALTDAEAVLGRLPGFPMVCGLDGQQPLDVDAARSALQALDSSRPVEEVAQGFRDVAHETMAAAIRRLAAAQGLDPSRHALVAFGGAGPGHACGVARRLGMREVWIPRTAGVFSAVGIGLARRRAEVVQPILKSDDAGFEQALQALHQQVPFSGEITVRLAARHSGTSSLIEIELFPGERLWNSRLRTRFDEAHRQRFGFERPEALVELVELRLVVEEGEPRSLPTMEAFSMPTTRVDAHFATWQPVTLCGLDDAHGLVGPALIQGPGCTIVLEEGWTVEVHASGLRLRDEQPSTFGITAEMDPIHTAVLGARLMGVAEQMGERLARLARSVSIRERRDFSCAVFDGGGNLVCNAPHIPVHLGAMGETIRSLLRLRGHELAPGQHWVCNDPYSGGSHLPDITVMTPVFGEGTAKPLMFVACRGHHIDVGGIRPGSMPPFSQHIDQEGFCWKPTLLADHRGMRNLPLPGCRQPGDVQADLEAQVAACSLGVTHLRVLLADLGVSVMRAQLGHLMNQAEAAVQQVLMDLSGDYQGVEHLDDGTAINVAIRIRDGRAHVQIKGPAHPGNLNAPRAVARAALLYVFRCLVSEAIPLNEGALRPFELDIEAGGLFDPQYPAAVAGGNVETSQRLVDALLCALGRQAASQGTMNNLTIGTPNGALYETIGGGSGATPMASGSSAVQIHMTNTPGTDVEELETRFPLRLETWRIRPGSGGKGRHCGGDGVEKIWRFLAPAEVSILAGRRSIGAPGLHGGGSGAPGEDCWERDGRWQPAEPEFQAKTGDRLRIRTPGGGGFGRVTDS